MAAKSSSPLIVLGLSVLVMLGLDAAVFRSGLYQHVMSPDTSAGKLYSFLHYEQLRTREKPKEVLLTGDSKMEWGFSDVEGKALTANSDLRVVNGAVPGSTLDVWYYALQRIDPHRDRYAAIVIPYVGYQAELAWYGLKNNPDSLQMEAPILTVPQWFDAARENWGSKLFQATVTTGGALGHAFAADIQDAVLNPRQRLGRLLDRQHRGTAGPEINALDNIESLVVDPVTNMPSSYPAHFQAFKRRETDNELGKINQQDADARLKDVFADNVYWMKRVLDLYKGSQTKIVLVNMPARPIWTKSHTTSTETLDLPQALSGEPNLVVIAQDAFSELNEKDKFYDVLHMNKKGQQAFTGLLVKRLSEVLAGGALQ